MSQTLAPVTAIPTRLMAMNESLHLCSLSEWLLCDGCDKQSPAVFAPSEDLIADARLAAQAEGWSCDAAGDTDLCPACLLRGESHR